MLKHRYKTKDEVPEKYRDLYTAKKDADGEEGFELTEVDGLKTVADVERLRESVRKERDEHEKTKDALKKATDEATANADKIKALEAKDDGKTKPIQELTLENERLKRENEQLKERSTQTETELGSIKGQVTAEKVRNALRKAWKGIIRDDALEDVIETEHANFIFDGTELLTKTGLSDNRSGLEPKAYGERLVKTRAYLVPPSMSGGARGGEGKAGVNASDNRPLPLADLIPPLRPRE